MCWGIDWWARGGMQGDGVRHAEETPPGLLLAGGGTASGFWGDRGLVRSGPGWEGGRWHGHALARAQDCSSPWQGEVRWEYPSMHVKQRSPLSRGCPGGGGEFWGWRFKACGRGGRAVPGRTIACPKTFPNHRVVPAKAGISVLQYMWLSRPPPNLPLVGGGTASGFWGDRVLAGRTGADMGTLSPGAGLFLPLFRGRLGGVPKHPPQTEVPACAGMTRWG